MICPTCGVYVTSENVKCRNCGCSLKGIENVDEHINEV
jgi:hypothetical protein